MLSSDLSVPLLFALLRCSSSRAAVGEEQIVDRQQLLRNEKNMKHEIESDDGEMRIDFQLD